MKKRGQKGDIRVRTIREEPKPTPNPEIKREARPRFTQADYDERDLWLSRQGRNERKRGYREAARAGTRFKAEAELTTAERFVPAVVAEERNERFNADDRLIEKR